MFVPNFKILGEVVAEKCVTKNFIWGKEKWTNKGNDNSMRMLNLSYTIQVVIPNVCTKFQNSGCSSFWGIFDTDFPTHYTGETDGKKEKGKKKAKEILLFFFFFFFFFSKKKKKKKKKIKR